MMTNFFFINHSTCITTISMASKASCMSVPLILFSFPRIFSRVVYSVLSLKQLNNREAEYSFEHINYECFDLKHRLHMSLKSKQKSLPRAPDILGKSQNWVQKVSSIRLSNIRVGQHITSLLGDTDKAPHDNIFVSSFIKLSRFRGDSVVITGGTSGVRLWKTFFNTLTMDFVTQLLFEWLDSACIDGCFFGKYDSNGAFLLKSEELPLQYVIRTVEIGNNSHYNERKFSGDAQVISSSNSYLFIGLSHGVLRILDPIGLEPLMEIPSLPNQRVVFATSRRWVAIESTSNNVSDIKITKTFCSARF